MKDTEAREMIENLRNSINRLRSELFAHTGVQGDWRHWSNEDRQRVAGSPALTQWSCPSCGKVSNISPHLWYCWYCGHLYPRPLEPTAPCCPTCHRAMTRPQNCSVGCWTCGPCGLVIHGPTEPCHVCAGKNRIFAWSPGGMQQVACPKCGSKP